MVLNNAIELLRAASFPKTVIVFGGPIDCGKSSAAKHLIEKYKFAEHPIATGPKDMMRVLGLTNAHLYGILKEMPTDLLCGQTPRHALQTVAEWGRKHISPTVWVEYWARTVPPNVDKVVIEDLRTVEGSTWMRQRGAVLVGLDRPGLDMSEERRQHVTEQQFNQITYDYHISNDGTLEDFKLKLDDLLLHVEADIMARDIESSEEGEGEERG